MRLDKFTAQEFDRGRSTAVEALWTVIHGLFLDSWIPGSYWRVALLRAFGARIGEGVVIKPHVRIKFPWRLTVGSHSWLGERLWIDNLAQVTVGSHCCLSQGVYICTGSHDWGKDAFDLVVKPIRIEDGAWVAAQAIVSPGVTVGRSAVLSIGSVAIHDLRPEWIHSGNPAQPVKARV
jgi:putative colanic acid biosynthesis acetyltransferase WcaF